MEDLANEFSSYAMIEDIGAPCGLMQPLAKNKSSDHLEDQSSNSKRNNFSNYKSKLNYSVNVPNSMISSQKSLPKPSKHRYSTRSSSIPLKSNSLVLSDSESTLSDDTKADGGSFFSERKRRVKKSKRNKPEKDVQNSYPFIPINNNDQYYGKRKRSTTISHNTYDNNTVGPQMSNYTINKLKRNEFKGLSMQCDFNSSKTSKLSNYVQNESKMDCDEQEDSTSLSDSTLSDSKFETDDNRFADDEQTDYELSSFHKRSNNRREYGRTSFEKTSSFGIINPFKTCLSSTSPSSSVLWAKRRRRNLPNNHFN